jgi:hypothetical protein
MVRTAGGERRYTRERALAVGPEADTQRTRETLLCREQQTRSQSHSQS